jgi:hypothetical protein
MSFDFTSLLAGVSLTAVDGWIGSFFSEKIDAVFRKWLARLPHPFRPEDRAAGYRYRNGGI